MVHPTAENAEFQSRYSAPFVFLVTNLPEHFRRWLAFIGIHEVDSPLRALFVERGKPVPHDFVTTLTNYNMRVDTEPLRRQAEERVRHSVVNTLFDKPSDTSNRVTDYINRFRDNLKHTLSPEDARDSVRSSVKVRFMEITLPGGALNVPVYNIYVHPPTAIPIRLQNWRIFLATQKYHAGDGGVGIKYSKLFRCYHCKTTDHPGGKCPLPAQLQGNAGQQIGNANADILPVPGAAQTPPQRGRGMARGNGGPNSRRGRARGHRGGTAGQ